MLTLYLPKEEKNNQKNFLYNVLSIQTKVFLLFEICLWMISIWFDSLYELNEYYEEFRSCISEAYRFLFCKNKFSRVNNNDSFQL
jgi:hypothetical protein